MGLARDFPAAKVLAACGEAKFLGSVGAKPQNPFRKLLGIKPFTRLGGAVNDLGVWIAGVFPVETAQCGFESL
jgi:hypothetical protein